MIEAFFLPFFSTLLAELGDKTQLMIICLASKTKKRLSLLMGAVLAFLVADGLAVLLGRLAGDLIPELYVKLVAGAVFIIFGLFTILKQERDEAESCELKTPFLSCFGLILMAEMGDKSQVMAALFAAEYNPFLVLAGTVLAMSILSIVAVMLGGLISKRLNRRTISIAAGALFILIGVYTLVEMLIGNAL